MQGAFVHHGLDFRTSRREDEPSAETIRALVCDVLGELNRSFGKLYSNEGYPSIPSEQLLCRCSTHSVGMPADGAIGLQSLVLLVRGAVAGRSGLGPDQLHEEP